MPNITVYTTPGCVQCPPTIKALTGRGIAHEVIDLSENAAAAAYVTEELGYRQAPVVVINDDEHWSGFRPDLIAKLA